MTWVLVGYIAKRRVTRAGWVSPWPDYPDAAFPYPAPVEEICSVSNCIARRLGGSELSLSLAETLANRITREATAANQQVELAFQLVLGRHPTSDELAWSNDFLRGESQPNQEDRRSSLHRLCLALFNANEFLYVD